MWNGKTEKGVDIYLWSDTGCAPRSHRRNVDRNISKKFQEVRRQTRNASKGDFEQRKNFHLCRKEINGLIRSSRREELSKKIHWSFNVEKAPGGVSFLNG